MNAVGLVKAGSQAIERVIVHQRSVESGCIAGVVPCLGAAPVVVRGNVRLPGTVLGLIFLVTALTIVV